jgi:GT2 family glycosyltransferase
MPAAAATVAASWRGPVALSDVEIEDPPSEVVFDPRYGRARLRLRSQGRLVGIIDELEIDDGILSGPNIQQALAGSRPPGGWLTPLPDPPRWPDVSVAVCTRGRGARVLGTVDAFEALRYDGRLEMVVVENVPEDDTLREAIETRPQRPDRPIRYAVESRPGASRARNRAAVVAAGELIAFTDDDATPEPGWVEAMAAVLASDHETGAVSGLTIPAELETAAQDWFEMFDAFNSGRRFERQIYGPRDPNTHPLYPYPLRIAGVNMAFRRDLLLDVGGFDLALGGGTPALGGEDTAIAAEILMSGHTIRFEPTAVVRHTHRRGEPELLKLMSSYGKGGSAYMTWCLHRHPIAATGLVKQVPPITRYFLTRGGSHDTGSRHEIPEYLTTAVRRGMVKGPAAYLRGARANSRLVTAPAAGY